MSGPVKLKTYLAPTAPEELVTATQAKAHIRVSASDDDTLITSLCVAARERAEEYLGRYILLRTVDAAWDVMPSDVALELPRSFPLVSVTSVKWYDDADASTTVSASTYHVDDYAEPGRIVLTEGSVWPDQGDVRTTNGLVVRYICGLVRTSVPEAISSAVKEIVRSLYDVDDDPSGEMLPPMAKRLLAPYKILRL